MKNQISNLSLLLVCTILVISCTESTQLVNPQNGIELRSQKLSKPNLKNANEMLGDRIVFTQVVQLEGAQEVPAVDTEMKGLAILRVSADKVLHSKVIIQKLAEGDALRASHVHIGAMGVNGGVRIFLAHDEHEFGKNIETQLTDAQYDLIMNGACYVNVHTNFKPGGMIRGQIR
jgi:hypothetical protein